jgi:predicted transcriptional regulator
MEIMNIESRKINLINWISSIQEADIIDKVEKIQREKASSWDAVSNEDKQAIEEGLKQLDKGEFLTRSQVRAKVKEKYNF